MSRFPSVACETCLDSGEAPIGDDWITPCPDCGKVFRGDLPPCPTCADTGEIITDWHAFLEPPDGDRASAVAKCGDCGGGDGC